jgi:CRP-like cAMP-binding protein
MENLNDILHNDSNAQTKQFKKGTILQSEGQVTSNAFFVKKGLLRSYTIDSKGKEHIFMFAPEGWLVADIESQEFEYPAELFIDCLEDSEISVFNRKSLLQVDLSSDQLKKNVQMLARRVGVLQRRVIMLMSSPASERYAYFLETYPLLSNRVPQRMIASYLGITPEALSKIRSRIAKSI